MHVTYEIVEHDGGWAYRWNGVYSEAFASRELAHAAATRAAAEQQVGGADAVIQYETPKGEWITERASGGDRPEADVKE